MRWLTFSSSWVFVCFRVVYCLLTCVSSSLSFRYNSCFPWSTERVECVTAPYILRNLWSSLCTWPAACATHSATSGRRSLPVSWMHLYCLISSAQIATHSRYFGGSLSVIIFDIPTSFSLGSTRVSDATKWRWISPGANHFTHKHHIGLRTSKFDHASKNPAVFTWVVWLLWRLVVPSWICWTTRTTWTCAPHDEIRVSWCCLLWDISLFLFFETSFQLLVTFSLQARYNNVCCWTA